MGHDEEVLVTNEEITLSLTENEEEKNKMHWLSGLTRASNTKSLNQRATLLKRGLLLEKDYTKLRQLARKPFQIKLIDLNKDIRVHRRLIKRCYKVHEILQGAYENHEKQFSLRFSARIVKTTTIMYVRPGSSRLRRLSAKTARKLLLPDQKLRKIKCTVHEKNFAQSSGIFEKALIGDGSWFY
ncbi:hypothetical protein Trydic_g22414 [Trypoxylus dichotomus]